MLVKNQPGKQLPAAAKAADRAHTASPEMPPDIGRNLRRLRNAQGFSLDALARRSGVSRAMLGQIETGKSMPTVTVVWKIAAALGVPVATLIDHARQPRSVVYRSDEGNVYACSEGQISFRSLHVADPRTAFIEVRITPGHCQNMAAGDPGSQASLVVAVGTMEISVGETGEHRLEAGDSILFDCDVDHSYTNPGGVEAIAYLVTVPAGVPRTRQ